MLINVRGPGPEGSDVTHKIQQGLGAKLHTQLVAKFGRRLVGREVWGTLPNGSLKRIDTQASPQDYGFAQEDVEWSLVIRTYVFFFPCVPLTHPLLLIHAHQLTARPSLSALSPAAQEKCSPTRA